MVYIRVYGGACAPRTDPGCSDDLGQGEPSVTILRTHPRDPQGDISLGGRLRHEDDDLLASGIGSPSGPSPTRVLHGVAPLTPVARVPHLGRPIVGLADQDHLQHHRRLRVLLCAAGLRDRDLGTIGSGDVDG